MALSTKTKNAINNGFGSKAGGAELIKVLDSAALSTAAQTDLFVSNSGSDSNPGTAQLPFATVQAALDSLPKQIKNPTTVNIMAGTFPGYVVDGFVISPSRTVNPNYLHIKGTLVDATIATGTTSGTLTAYAAASGSTFAVLTDSTQSWTTNNLAGKLVQIVTGTGSGESSMYVIYSNTATAITLVGNATATAAGATYAILDHGTNISGVLPATTAALNPSGLSDFSRVVQFANNQSGSGQGVNILMTRQNVIATVSATTHVYNFGPNRFYMGWVKMSDTGTLSGTGLICADFASVIMRSCYTKMFTGGSALSMSSPGRATIIQSWFDGGGNCINASGNVSLANSAISGFTSNSIQTNTTSGAAAVQVTNSRLTGQGGSAVGITSPTASANGQSLRVAVSTSDISSYATAIQARSNLTYVGMASVTGTGNTTGLLANDGARIKIDAASTITGTTEIQLQSTTSSLATMRAASPKQVSDAILNIVHE